MPTFATNDIDILLQQVFNSDSLILSYCPGGYCASNPAQGTEFPCIRAWQQSPGNDTLVQGTLAVLMSNPKFMVGVEDYWEVVDWFTGSSPVPNGIDLAVRRIHQLLHGITFTVNGFQYLATAKSASMRQPGAQIEGKYRPWQGYWFEFNVQQAN